MNKVNLHHPQLYSLYSHGMRIDHNIIQEILELPRETLIADLETIIRKSIDNFDYYKNLNLTEAKRAFPIHAFFILSEIKSEYSLFVALAFLSQPEAVLKFWCGKYTKELLWEVIYTLGNNSLKFLKSFLKAGVNSLDFNRVILKSVSQIALHQPERRTEIVNWYKDMIYFLMQAKFEDYHYPFSLTGTVVSGILDFHGVELFNEVRILFDMNKVDKSICGNMDDFTTELRTELPGDFKSKLYGIFDRYNSILNDRDYYNRMEDIKDEHNEQRSGLINN